MIECEVWIDVECLVGDQCEVVCTIFSRQSFPVRPLVGERLSFHSSKDAKHAFNLATTWGPMRSSGASSEIEEVWHYRGPMSELHVFTVSLRCSRIAVHSTRDAEALVAFLTLQHGFEIDPYGPNKLGDGAYTT